MAVRACTITEENAGMRKATWTGLLNGDTMAPKDLSEFTDKTIHISGTIGAGGSITLYGSSLDADVAIAPGAGSDFWIPLKDNLDNNITKTAVPGGDVIIENYQYTSGKVTAGDGTTSLTVTITCKKASR